MPRHPRRAALATLDPGRVRDLERRGLFNADTEPNDVLARVVTRAAPPGRQPRLILNAARSGAATAAR
jgi:hypothetical protein